MHFTEEEEDDDGVKVDGGSPVLRDEDVANSPSPEPQEGEPKLKWTDSLKVNFNI